MNGYLLSTVFLVDPSSFNVVTSSSAVQCPVQLCITAVNTGQSVWLSALGSNNGAVKLAWQWVKEGQAVSGFAGAEPLRHDVFPGVSYEFQMALLPIPTEPGEYLLELEMASAHFGGFPRRGNEPVAIPVTVPTWTPEVLLGYLKSPVVASTDTPKLTLMLDRSRYHPGEHLRMIYQLVGAEKPVLINAYLAVQQPNGDVTLATVSDQGHIKPTGNFRSEGSIHINKRFRFSGVLNLPLGEDLPVGDYTLYFFLTEAGNYQMLTKARAHFLLEPYP